MLTAYLGLGSNLGDRVQNIRSAVDSLAAKKHICIDKVSSFYETSPVGFVDQPNFVNAVVKIETDLSPLDLLHTILDIEKTMGRVRNIRWGPRVIDIDVLLYDDVSINTEELTIPHPRMMERAFVVIPLAEVSPELRLPNGRTAYEVAQDLRDQGVAKLAEVT